MTMSVTGSRGEPSRPHPRSPWRRMGALTVSAAVVLSGCISIPNSSPVQEGNGEVPESNPIRPFAEGPKAGDGPTSIVSGFLTASAAGFASDFSVSREYLTTEASAEWDPAARVVVFDSGALTPEWDESTSTIQYTVPVAAEVDDSGILVEAPDGTREPLNFRLVLDEDGEYRIAELDDGAVIAQANFDRLFLPVALAFSSVDRTTVVPELRWLPQNNGATWATRELIEGPSPWLANAVVTGFPPGAALEVDSVVVTDGIAAVHLNPESAGTPADRSLVQEQLSQTLGTLPGVVAVTVTVGGVALGGDGTATLDPAPAPDGNAAAIVGDRLGLWDGTGLFVVADDIGALPWGSTEIARSFDGPDVAFLVGQSTLAVSNALRQGSDGLIPFSDDLATLEAVMEYDDLYTGRRLVGPSFDREGWIWTAEAANAGSVVAVQSGADAVGIDAPWLDGRSVQSVTVSRDGTRVAILSREGGQQMTEVAAVVRTEQGAPLTLGAPVAVGTDITTAIDAHWVDNLNFAILGEAQDEVPSSLWVTGVGGETILESAPAGVVSVTARLGQSSLTTVGTEGAVHSRVGNGWEEVVTGVDDLAYAG